MNAPTSETRPDAAVFCVRHVNSLIPPDISAANTLAHTEWDIPLMRLAPGRYHIIKRDDETHQHRRDYLFEFKAGRPPLRVPKVWSARSFQEWRTNSLFVLSAEGWDANIFTAYRCAPRVAFLRSGALSDRARADLCAWNSGNKG